MSPQAGALQSTRSSPSAEVGQAPDATTAAARDDGLAAAGAIDPLETVIRSAIERAIALCDGNIPRAANALKVSPSTLYRRIQMWSQTGEGDGPQDRSNG